jgi:maleylacetate reductase
VLGGSFDLPHAETHALVLPYAFAFNRPAVPDAARRLADALEAKDPVDALFGLARDVDAPDSLAELGMPRSGIDRAVDLLLTDSYWNPRPLTKPDLRELLAAMYDGSGP